jgi:hypothetical protein
MQQNKLIEKVLGGKKMQLICGCESFGKKKKATFTFSLSLQLLWKRKIKNSLFLCKTRWHIFDFSVFRIDVMIYI